MKKVSFNARPSSVASATNVDAWVENREGTEQEPVKRLTIEIPLSLHRRMKSHCAQENLAMAVEVRRLLEQRFPAPQDTEHARLNLDGVPS